MAGLSAAANVFSVVGLADIVFRLGVNTADLYSRYRDASKDIASLVDEIQAFVETVTQIRLYLDEYRQSPYTQTDGQTPPPQLSKTLSDCETELLNLKRFAVENGSRPDDGLAVQMMKRFRWTSQQVQVLKSRERIGHLNMILQTNLVHVGRKNEIVLRNELKSTRADIATAGSTVHQALHTLEGNLTKNQEATNTLVQSQTALMSQMIKHSENHHLSMESKINSKQENFNALVLGQTTLINQMIKMTENHHQELLERIPNLTLQQTEDDDFIFQGDNLGSIVLPLLLMKSELFKTVKTLQKEGVLKVSRSEAEWILQQIDNLLAKSHEAAARDLKGKGLTDGKRTITGSFGMDRRNYLPKHEERIAADQKVSTFDQIGRITHTSTVDSSSGVLILQTGHSNKHSKHCQDLAEIQIFRLSFFPKPEFSSINISMLMTNELGRNMQLQIPRLIQTYNTIPLSEELDGLIHKEDIRGLEQFFRTGRASLNDILEQGLSILQYAALTERILVCEFLFHAGASASVFTFIDGAYSTNILCYIWTSAHLNPLGKDCLAALNKIDNALHLSNLAISHGCDPNIIVFPHNDNMLHRFIWNVHQGNESVKNANVSGSYNIAHLPVNKVCEVFSSMVGMGCELEGRDLNGETALLRACSMLGPKMIAALIDIGADINATDNHRNGVLHQILIGAEIMHPDCEDSLYRGLTVLLANNADPNHFNNLGGSPSDYALKRPTSLDAWKKAIEDAGYKILTLTLKSKIDDLGSEEDIEEIMISVIVSAGFELSGDNTTLPVSNITLVEWLKKRVETLLDSR